VSRADPNRAILARAVDRLGELADRMVFVGGCATGLLITDPAAAPIRATRDVDTLVEVASRQEYYRLAEQLRAKGFREDDSGDAPMCRWRGEDVLLDVMPTRGEILGFANRWYPEAVRHAVPVPLSPESGAVTIRLITAPYFIATKIEAFADRGHGDFLVSHDFEDLVAVMDGRPGWVEEVQASETGLLRYLADRFTSWLADPDFREALPGHLMDTKSESARVARLVAQLRTLVAAEFDASDEGEL
jgi:predicted nucleotidyltransferase